MPKYILTIEDRYGKTTIHKTKAKDSIEAGRKLLRNFHPLSRPKITKIKRNMQ